jgi:hypothetical protein
VIVYTDDFGVATSTFTSGSLSSDNEGVTIEAFVVGKPLVTDEVSIKIGGTAGSVFIGRSTVINSINNGTAYSLPMSVLVADSSGNAIAGARVSLSVWPRNYQRGIWLPGDEECPLQYWGSGDAENPGSSIPNEDTNRNLILDTNPPEDQNGDGELTPPNSAAGSLPSTISADENGVGEFNLVYLKSSAAWIEVEVTASTLVLGTETQSTYVFFLPYEVGDSCSLPVSPYN